MKQKYLTCFLLLTGLASVCSAQKTEPVNITDAKTVAVNFKKMEPGYRQVQNELKQLEQQKTQLLTLMRDFDEQQKQVTLKLEKLETGYDEMGGNGTSQSELLNATKQMQETQMSFNLQYLQLQSQMQHENRSYTAISNIMKTKHDTVKNSISNVR
jgi:septal ring factor EnvC (AmiA/AmiB activator)